MYMYIYYTDINARTACGKITSYMCHKKYCAHAVDFLSEAAVHRIAFMYTFACTNR